MVSKKIASCRRVLYNKNVLIDKSGIYLINAIVGRGHDPADHVAVLNTSHSTKVLTNLLPTGGVMMYSVVTWYTGVQ